MKLHAITFAAALFAAHLATAQVEQPMVGTVTIIVPKYDLSICQFVNLPICQFVNLSICQFVNLPICQFVDYNNRLAV